MSTASTRVQRHRFLTREICSNTLLFRNPLVIQHGYRVLLGWDYIPEISVRIVFHRESTIEISPRPIYSAIRPRICDYIRYNGKVCAKKTCFPPFFGKDLAQTFPARYPDRPGGPAGYVSHLFSHTVEKKNL
jgi:hypothetical protein